MLELVQFCPTPLSLHIYLILHRVNGVCSGCTVRRTSRPFGLQGGRQSLIGSQGRFLPAGSLLHGVHWVIPFRPHAHARLLHKQIGDHFTAHVASGVSTWQRLLAWCGARTVCHVIPRWGIGEEQTRPELPTAITHTFTHTHIHHLTHLSLQVWNQWL